MSKYKLPDGAAFPFTAYLRQHSTGYIHDVKLTSETSRSWVSGGAYEWNQTKWAKNEYGFVTEADYRVYQWANRHSVWITDRLRYSRDAALILAVAKLIGYEPLPEQDGGGE